MIDKSGMVPVPTMGAGSSPAGDIDPEFINNANSPQISSDLTITVTPYMAQLFVASTEVAVVFPSGSNYLSIFGDGTFQQVLVDGEVEDIFDLTDIPKVNGAKVTIIVDTNATSLEPESVIRNIKAGWQFGYCDGKWQLLRQGYKLLPFPLPSKN
jgi:hypothetical protein